ncbi:MAG TPA: glycosyl transferase [Cyanobacteria bacterium UBA8803]|nr:glycosyl transferase [Cyanobacteria bacterium UBA9273]HBL62101.1 glycosyl transferase [Cyanobacteria bacterium UBA8803]
MKFSIVITTYNRLSLLRRAIDIALAQTVPCETIVVDDCSSDGTQAYVEGLCESLQRAGDSRLIYHRNRVHLGHSGSVNAGVARATGDWIKFMDDDDYLAPNCIEEMGKAIALHPGTVICSCQAIQVDSQQAVISKTRQVGPSRVSHIPQEDIHYGMLLELLPFGTPIQVACSRDAFLKSGGWDSSLDTNFDDIDSWIKIAQFGDAIFLNQYLAYRTLWEKAYNHKLSIKKRLETNLLIKEKIYALVSNKHRHKIPQLQDIKNYIRLHWALIALKKGNPTSAIELSYPAILSPTAWQLLSQELRSKFLKKESSTRESILPSFQANNNPESVVKI